MLCSSVIHLVRQILELVVQGFAEGCRAGDQGNGDQGCDQAVFNGGRAGFVLHQAGKNRLHVILLTSVVVQHFRQLFPLIG